MSKLTSWQVLCKNIRENPEKWSTDKYYFQNIDTGVSLWIANGLFSTNVCHPFNLYLSIYGKIKVWFAYKEWLRWNLERKLIGGSE